MKKIITVWFWIFPVLVFAQGAGIKWTEDLTWTQIKEKAKLENKYILIDAYATWCVPCKKMDKEVYPSEIVAGYINDKFIAVKVQMDTTKSDNEQIRSWRIDAATIQKQYAVEAYPTFLFISPDGKLAHRDAGYKNTEDFISLAKTAYTNPIQLYNTELNEYHNGKKDYPAMVALMKKAYRYKDKETSNELAVDYLHNYLNKLPESELCTADKLELFIYGPWSSLVSSKDKIFRLCYKMPEKVNRLMKDKGLSTRFTNWIIYKEEIAPVLSQVEPNNVDDIDWEKLRKWVQKKYNKQSGNIVLSARVSLYNEKKSWKPSNVKYFIQAIEAAGLDTTNVLSLVNVGNSIEYSILRYSNDFSEINKGIGWLELIMRCVGPGGYDYVYAGLLYKSGKRDIAIQWQERSIQWSEYEYKKNKKDINNEKWYKKRIVVLEEMKKRMSPDKIDWNQE